MFRKEAGFNFPLRLPRKISRANLFCQLPVYLSLEEMSEISCGMNYFTVASQIVSLIPKYLTPRFVVSVTFLKQGLVIKRRVTGVKDRTIDIFPFPATGDSKNKFLFLNTIYFELLLQHCHLIWCLCPGASLLPQEELWISIFPPQAFLGHFGELCFSLCHKSLLLPKQ